MSTASMAGVGLLIHQALIRYYCMSRIVDDVINQPFGVGDRLIELIFMRNRAKGGNIWQCFHFVTH